ILRLFAKHASQHSLLPERHGEKRTKDDIRRDAVEEMYRHCEVNHLCEVWAYLWNSWYSRKRWPLWARGAYSASIPCKRTTMMVEALWRNLKRLVLHMYNRLPVDLAVHAIITKALPPYRLTLRRLLRSDREGRAQALTTMQEHFKHSWERLMKVPIKGTYTTDVHRWTCDCGAQKYHAYLLCKHLVRAAGNPPALWWVQVQRFHIPPFYTVPIDGKIAPPPELTTKHAWLSRMPRVDTSTSDSDDSDSAIVTGSGHGKRAAAPPGSVNMSRASQAQVPVADTSEESGEEDSVLPALAVTSRSSPIDSSPNKPPPTGRDGLLRARVGGSAGFTLDDEDDVDVDEHLRLLHRAADIIEEQRDAGAEGRFVQNALRATRPAVRWARDIEKHERRRTMPITNTRERGQAAPSNVIGYKYIARR
ncbi:uncharacterized protein B0H18DRAFT_1063631, partial [Fomitopsis serialis]|uniref:uncharacterized protein n=1 Tax=Fomitopsis serialis TaxID=139415 RepID=UPI002008D4A7